MSTGNNMLEALANLIVEWGSKKSHAYGVISQRTGEMQNGVFVKDE